MPYALCPVVPHFSEKGYTLPILLNKDARRSHLLTLATAPHPHPSRTPELNRAFAGRQTPATQREPLH
jgi:hypothetical protein